MVCFLKIEDFCLTQFRLRDRGNDPVDYCFNTFLFLKIMTLTHGSCVMWLSTIILLSNWFMTQINYRNES